MTQVRTHHHRAKQKGEEEVEIEEATVEADLSKTDELLDRIEDVLEDQAKIEFKEKLRRGAQNQRRLSPRVEMYRTAELQQSFYEEIALGGFNKDCPCCGLPLDGPPGPECLSGALS